MAVGGQVAEVSVVGVEVDGGLAGGGDDLGGQVGDGGALQDGQAGNWMEGRRDISAY